MAAFSYQALNVSGKKVKGVLEGDSPRQIRAQLREQKLKPIEVVAVSEKRQKDETRRGAFMRTRMNSAELALITRQLATLIQSNLPLDEALGACAQQAKKQNIKSLMLEVRSRVVEGHTLAYALGESPKVFNELYRAMVRAGEHAGFLGLVLDRLADYTENSQETQRNLQMAMIYPFILVLVAVSVIAALMAFVVPELVKVFQNTDAELPLLTQILISISDYITSYGLHTIAAIVALVYAARALLKDPGRKKKYHRFLLRLPFIANIVRGMDTARFASTLSILMASGVPLLEALRISGAVLSNLVLRENSGQIAAAVQEGSSLSRALDKSGEFPPMMVHMVASGEASGELESMLERAARNQERELDSTLKTVMGIFEPLMVVSMGGFVLLIVLAIMMPIFEMNSLVK